MNIKSWFHPRLPPRILLIFPAILVMLLAMLAGALALTYANDALAVVGMVLGAGTPKLLAYISHDLSSSDAVALLDQAVSVEVQPYPVRCAQG